MSARKQTVAKLTSGSAHKNEKEQPFETKIPLKRKRQERNCENFKEVIQEILDCLIPLRCRVLYERTKLCQALIKNILLFLKASEDYPITGDLASPWDRKT